MNTLQAPKPQCRSMHFMRIYCQGCPLHHCHSSWIFAPGAIRHNIMMVNTTFNSVYVRSGRHKQSSTAAAVRGCQPGRQRTLPYHELHSGCDSWFRLPQISWQLFLLCIFSTHRGQAALQHSASSIQAYCAACAAVLRLE